MNSYQTIPNSTVLPGGLIQLDGFEISWAGLNPAGNLCFGSYDGRFRKWGEEGPSEPACPSREAINEIAFSGRAMAASTRCDVAFIVFDDEGLGHLTVYEGGAHGVIAIPSGGFIAPLGVHGLLAMRPVMGPRQFRVRFRFENRPNFYRLTALAQNGGHDIVVGASRDDGLAILELSSSQDLIDLKRCSFLHRPGVDVVDVCSLKSAEWPRAAAWLDADLTISLSRDVLEDGPIRVIRISEIPGKAYSLLQNRGHLFLLTTQGLFILPCIASRFLSGQLDGGSVRVFSNRSKSIDEIYIAADSLLLSVDGGIYRTPVDSIITGVDPSIWTDEFTVEPIVAETAWEQTEREWSIQKDAIAA